MNGIGTGYQESRKRKKKERLRLYMAAMGVTALYAVLCHNDSVWADEAYTMLLVQKPWPAAWEMLIHDVHPPLYYVVVKLVCMVAGYTVPVVKGVSVCCIGLLLLLGIWLVYPDFGMKTAVIYMLAAGLMPQMLRHGVELRMYAMAAFFVTACGLLAIRLWNTRTADRQRRVWAGFWTAGLAAAYTHYFALVAVAWIYALLLAAFWMERRYVRRRCHEQPDGGGSESCMSQNGNALRAYRGVLPSGEWEGIKTERQKATPAIRKWMLCLAASAAAYLPWLFVFAGQAAQVGQSYWIVRPSAGTIVRWSGWLLKTTCMPVSVLLTALYAVGFLWLIWCGVVRHAGQRQRFLSGAAGFVALLLTVLTGITVTFLLKPVFVPRYMVPAAGLAAFGLAVFAGSLSGRQPVLICVLVTLTGVLGYRDVWAEEYGTRTAQTRLMLEQVMQPGDTLAYDYDHLQPVLEYYFPEYRVESSDTLDWNRPGTVWYCQIFRDMTEEEMDALDLDWTMVGEYEIDQYVFRLYQVR